MIITKAKINFSNLSVPPIIPVVQGDTGRVIQFELNDFTIPAGATATYYVQKPSGEAVYNEATISGNNVFVELTAQSIIEVGENYGQVRILVDEEVVTSFDFILLVKVFRGIDAVQSETEMNIFDKAVERAQETIASTVTEAEAAIEAAAQEAEEYIAQAIDPTLTITDKAADAKVAGDGLKGIAAAFDTQEQYFAGDYVRKDFKLYRRIADCTSVWGDGSWIAAKWQETNLGNEILQRNLIAASRYDHTRDYAVGEYCTHDRWLYRCISPVTGGSTGDIGNWDSTKWEAVRIGEELTDLKEALTTVNETLPTKADKDGVVASAEQLLSDVGTEDKAPYLFRATPYDSTRVDEEVVGCSVGWNQLIPNVNISTVTDNGITFTVNADKSVTLSGTATAQASFEFGRVDPIDGHQYLFYGIPSGASNSGYYANIFRGKYSTDSVYLAISSDYFVARIRVESGTTVSNVTFNLHLIDLTAWFGKTIADYAKSLETATAGSGVAFIKALLPGGYIPYSAPTLKSVSGLVAHKCVGFNLFDKGTAIDGKYVNGTGGLSDNSNCFCSDYIRVFPNTNYYTNAYGVGLAYTVRFFDANKTFIGSGTLTSAGVFGTGNATYIRVSSLKANVSADKLVVNVSSSRNGEYEPYGHTYALDSDLTLRGILKMDADHNVYADGDVYKSDGTVTRHRSAEIDLSTYLTTYDSSHNRWYGSALSNIDKSTVDSGNGTIGIVCSTLVEISNNALYTYTDSPYVIACHPDGVIYARGASDGTKPTGVFTYPLATPTTETADPYASPQNCTPGGTEEYVYAEGGSGIPVGHDSKYLKNLRSELERVSVAVPEVGSTAGTYTLKATVTAQGVTYGWVAE